MGIVLKKATKTQSKLRILLEGISGSGKTMTALKLAKAFGSNTVFIDTENSATKYLKTAKMPDGFEFDVPTKEDGSDLFGGKYDPKKLIAILEELGKVGGIDTVIVDSLSHFWVQGNGGFLDLVEEEAQKIRARSNKADTFAAWRAVDPIYRRLLDTIRNVPFNIICCLRVKAEYERGKDENGKPYVKKLGMKPEFRELVEHEFDAELIMNDEHVLIPGKHRMGSLLDGKVFVKPGEELAKLLLDWASDGESYTPPPQAARHEPQPSAGEFEALLADIVAGKGNADKLADVQRRARGAKTDGKLTDDQWKQLGQAFKEAMTNA